MSWWLILSHFLTAIMGMAAGMLVMALCAVASRAEETAEQCERLERQLGQIRR